MTLRCAVVDDEPLARELLAEMLAALPDVEVAAVYEDGDAAAAGLARDRPDLLFLDIRMPGRDGFDVLSSLPPDRRPTVVFVTAFDDRAVEAFEVEAADYVLKPFDEERLAAAVERARRRRAGGGPDLERILAAVRTARRPEPLPPRLVVRDEDRSVLLDLREIEWIEAAGKKVEVHARGRSYELREGIGRIAERLEPHAFARISRSAVVNLGRVREVQPWFGGEHLVVLAGGAKVPTTRGFRGAIVDLLARG